MPRAPRAPKKLMSALKLVTRHSFAGPQITLPQDRSPKMRPPKEILYPHCGGRLRVPQPTTLRLDLTGPASHTLHLASRARRMFRIKTTLAAFKDRTQNLIINVSRKTGSPHAMAERTAGYCRATGIIFTCRMRYHLLPINDDQ